VTGGLAAVVLAAGAGNRLRPLTDLRPKALCPVDNVPLLDLALARVRPHTREIAVNVHHGREQMLAHLSDRTVQVSIEPEPLGTAGALGRLRPWLAGRAALVTNVDAWLPDGLGNFVDGWDGRRARLLVVADPERADFPDGSRYAGAALMPWALVSALPAEPAGLYEVCWRAAAGRGELDVVRLSGRFVDCGTPADYLAANLAAAGGRSVVGPGADVRGRLVRCVVWPDGSVRPGERLVEAVRASAEVTVAAR
jgi:MurNAc alpha-1-phosphate uridylyltransferase